MLTPAQLFQLAIRAHGRLEGAKLLDAGSYAVKHSDGYAYVVNDPARAPKDDPVRRTTNWVKSDDRDEFRNLWSAVIFEGREGKDRDRGSHPADKSRPGAR